MFQKEFNKICNQRGVQSDVFKRLPQTVKGKFVHTSIYRNEYQTYLTKTKQETTLDGFLQAIAYNTNYNCFQWGQHPKYLYMYKKINGSLKQTLSDTLCNKIMSSIPTKPFIDAIVNTLADYHILFDDDGKPLTFDKYPLIYWTCGYFESFTTIYLTNDLTRNDLNSLANMCSGNNILINLYDKIKLVKLRGKHKFEVKKGDIIVETYEKTPLGILQLILSLTNHKPSSVEFTNTEIDKLFNMLKIKL